MDCDEPSQNHLIAISGPSNHPGARLSGSLERDAGRQAGPVHVTERMRPQPGMGKGVSFSVGVETLSGKQKGIALVWSNAIPGSFRWLRGVDLNHRPLGYEPDRSI